MWVMAENKPKLSDFNRGFANPQEWLASNSPYRITPESNMEVMRIEEMITN